MKIEYTEDPSSKEKQMIANMITKIEPQMVINPVIVTTTGADANQAPAVAQTTTTTRVNSL